MDMNVRIILLLFISISTLIVLFLGNFRGSALEVFKGDLSRMQIRGAINPGGEVSALISHLSFCLLFLFHWFSFDKRYLIGDVNAVLVDAGVKARVQLFKLNVPVSGGAILDGSGFCYFVSV